MVSGDRRRQAAASASIREEFPLISSYWTKPTGQYCILKVPPHGTIPGRAVLNGLDGLAAEGIDPRALYFFVGGTSCDLAVEVVNYRVEVIVVGNT